MKTQNFTVPDGTKEVKITEEEKRLVIEFIPEKPQPKIGEWWWNEVNKKAFRCSVNYGAGTLDSDLLYRVKPEWIEKFCTRLATTSEIKSTLKRVAEAKGYKEGVKFSREGINSNFKTLNFTIGKYLLYYNGKLDTGQGYIYDNSTDTWAEIIKKITLTDEQIEAVIKWMKESDIASIVKFRKEFSDES